MNVEYEWKPQSCTECQVFGHVLDTCPKRVVEPVKDHSEDQTDGFTTVQNRKKKGKKVNSGQHRYIDGLKLNKPKPKYAWNVKQNQNINAGPKTTQDDAFIVKLKNHFTVLQDDDNVFNVQENGESSGGNDNLKDYRFSEPILQDSESKIEEMATHKGSKGENKGASTPPDDWTSNATLCEKGCRIIMGWNKDVVDMSVVAQSSQSIHTKIIHMADNKKNCTFIYAGNDLRDKRQLWPDLGFYKNVVRGCLWVLLGDFNVALNMEDTFTSSSSMNSAMCEFKDCIENIKVLDINSFVLQFTWNQKPKGSGGILKKLDWIIGNIEFVDLFPGAYAMFQPYRISDHSPSVLKIPSITASKPKPFKFYNFLAHKEDFLGVVTSHWNKHVEGYSMFCVVQKLKSLKKPLYKLMHEQGNLHDQLNTVGLFDKKVSKISNVNMMKPISNDEIKKAMFSIRDGKAPGLDGYTSAFFKKRDIHGFFKRNRGLRQGDPLSPYLFTLVMEILTLILRRKVSLSDSFRYHNHCEELDIINVCFADDLFLFAGGDVGSATVIMDSLNEFKNVSGSVPSIPKSNLLVKYLGVSLISSRLLNKDCKILVEKARNRIADWKNKSLSFAGIISDIQQLIRGFIWCNGEYKRGKVKVAWEDICLPKKEGGLGLRSLDVFNLALMSAHIWNIVSNKESLWERMRPFFRVQIGNGLNTSLWYDMWCSISPLSRFLTPRDIAREGFSLQTHVADLMLNGVWNWRNVCLSKAPELGSINPLALNNCQDSIRWCDSDGNK
ncbi:RNA-directed DNA polymerase, eukaryota, reverse transcriptase zinc-binding domain protein [Tanacetum coccineum]